MLNRVASTFTRSNLGTSARYFSVKHLKERLSDLVPQKRAFLKQVKEKYGKEVLGHSTVDQTIGGMRSVKCMLYQTSLLDAEEGIRFRGHTIPEVQAKLPKAPGGHEPLPEGLFWLLCTGEIPTQAEVRHLTNELHQRSTLPAHVVDLLNKLPKTMHPMTQFSMAVMALQTESVFAKAYREGTVKKTDYWIPVLEDSLNLIARIPQVAAMIYRNTFHGGVHIEANHHTDWASNFAHMLGFKEPTFHELMRLYLTIHADHEGGNVSAHTTWLVASALSDPYLSFAAGLNGLAGPLHGLANQEVLRWIMNFRHKLGDKDATQEEIVKALWDTLHSGQVIPGYGHAVLRRTDPRFTCQREFALRHFPNDPLVKLVGQLYDVVPDVLTKHGKTANPWPNVDAHSGVLLYHYNLREYDYYTVLFGVSRALGVLANMIDARILGLPLERPKSLTLEWMHAHFEKLHAQPHHHSHGHGHGHAQPAAPATPSPQQ
eukprot:TRINITY_DN144_c0_g1_i1.p1 TRINITY_DN144_c0_g1~~TRINITY_DN144_c0_g1_i1.p1  ORF type:complete len:487 (+),score=224.68 TRINITY_DN144_c0_g1_i1:74-1534(+)